MYVLKSNKDNKLYIGYTSDLKKRLKEHNLGLVRSTKSRKPFTLIYYEAYQSKNEAKHREYSLKRRGKALSQLKQRITKSINN